MAEHTEKRPRRLHQGARDDDQARERVQGAAGPGDRGARLPSENEDMPSGAVAASTGAGGAQPDAGDVGAVDREIAAPEGPGGAAMWDDVATATEPGLQSGRGVARPRDREAAEGTDVVAGFTHTGPSGSEGGRKTWGKAEPDEDD